MPAARAMPPPALAAEAVTVDPFNPKDTLFAFENTNALKLFEVVPALKLTFVMPPALLAEAVMVPLFSPKLTPFEFENTIPDKLLD